MNLYTKILLFLLISQLFIIESQAQIINPVNALSGAPMTNEQKIEEVYGPHFFTGKPELYNAFLDIFNRIRYVASTETADDKYPHLDNVPLLDKINPSLVRDSGYDPNMFNPIKYQMEFFAKSTKIYRIDHEYIIVISPLH